MGWTATDDVRPCPICGRAEGCAVADGAAWCTAGLALEHAPDGWVRVANVGDGVHYLKAGEGAHLEAEDREAVESRDARILKAARLWGNARARVEGTRPGCPEGSGPEHHRVREYLEARGVDVGRLPGGRVPPSLRYFGRCPRGMSERLPAVLCAFQDQAGAVRAVQRIYLDPAGEPRKADGEAKLTLGDLGKAQGGGWVRLSEADHVNGVLVLTEGIETGLAVLAALQDTGACVGAVVSTVGLKLLRLHPMHVLPSAGGWVRRVIIAGDYDAEKFGQGGESRGRPGEVAARRCAEQLKADWPRLDVQVALPGHQVAPELVRADGWVSLGESTGADGKPTEGKSVDWLDVVRTLGHEAAAVALLRPLELDRGRDADVGEQFKRSKLLPPTPLQRARLVLEHVWHPNEAGGAWRIRWCRGQWWVRDDDGLPQWRAVGAEFIEERVRHFLDPWVVLKHGKPEAAALNGTAVRDICAAMISFVGVVAPEMPAWLPASVDDRGQPLEGTVLRFAAEQHAGDVAPDWIVCGRNGLLEVDAWCQGRVVVRPPTTRWFSRTCLPYDFDVAGLEALDPDEPGMAWGMLCRLAPYTVKFLEHLTDKDPGRLEALQEFAGYVLTPFNVYKKMLWVQGPPGGGKSTLFKLLCKLVGAGNYAMATWGNAESRFNAAIVGPNLLVVDDLRIPRKSDTSEGLSRFLTMIGGGEVQVEDKHVKAAAAMRFPGKFVVGTNEDPDLPDNSGAWVDRMLFVRTAGKPARVDPFLLGKLEREIPALLVWALEGLRQLHRRGGFNQPGADADALGDIKRALQPVATFVADEYVTGLGWWVNKAEFLKEFNAWMVAQSPEHRAWSEKSVWRQLQAASVPMRRAERRADDGSGLEAWWVGLRKRLPGEPRDHPWHLDHPELPAEHVRELHRATAPPPPPLE